MKLKFLGAAGTVTGSSYILTSGSGRSILIDLGMFQGPASIEKLNYEPYEYDCANLSGAVLTHAHLDHCGRLPILLSHGYKGEIWMTPSTRDLTQLSLLDSAKVAEMDQKPVLYDHDLAMTTINQFRTMEYRKPFSVGDFIVTFRDAGHILGSASLEVEDTKPDSPTKKIVFSGDLGNTPEDLVLPTELISQADAVVMESTYGDRLHPQENPADKLQEEINEVEKTGGTLLIPAFSLERTQELLHMILHLKQTGKVHAQTPVLLDSPMAEKATRIYMNYPQLFNDHVKEHFVTGNPFDFPGLHIIGKRSESQRLDTGSGTQVIIAGSGMMSGGRIVGHAAHYLPIASTRLLIVGFQGEETLGRELLEGHKMISIEGKTIPVLATISSTRAMSSHADQQQLIAWLKNIQGVQKVFLTHGENEPRAALAKKITEVLGHTNIVQPVLHEEVSF